MSLPPLDTTSFDGEKYSASIHRDEPMPKCNHSGKVTLVNSREIKCSCGAGWTGSGIERLLDSFNNPNSPKN